MGAAGCGPSVPPAGPKDMPRAGDATGRTTVPAVDGPSTPLIVDWQPEQRADLEEAIRDGVVVVRYDDKGLALLKGCRAAGEYGYIGVTSKTQVIRLESAEEIAANLPLSGAAIIGEIGADLERGATLEIALMMIGKKRTAWRNVTQQDLDGRCDGATHYIRGLTVGAFAMHVGTRQKARAAAEIFRVGASGATGDLRSVESSDGKLEDCEQATPDSVSPPGQCAALLRIELEPVTAAADKALAPAAEQPEVKAEEREACAPGLVFLEGKCGKPAEDRPHLCKPGDVEDCRAQCEKNHAQSCDRYAVLVSLGKEGSPDPEKANQLFEKACSGGSPSACANLGVRYLHGTGARKDPKRAASFLEQACNEGEARGCASAAEIYRSGEGGVARDAQRALQLYTKGCDGGDQLACTNLAVLYAGADGIAKDERKALALSTRACQGGNATACGNAGLRYEFGMGVAQDLGQAVRLFDRACRMERSACLRLGILYMQGLGVPKDDRKAQELFDRTCAAKAVTSMQPLACFVSARLFGSPLQPLDPAQLERAAAVMQPQCDQKAARACSFVGVARLAQNKKPEGEALLEKACDLKDGWACDLQQRLKGP